VGEYPRDSLDCCCIEGDPTEEMGVKRLGSQDVYENGDVLIKQVAVSSRPRYTRGRRRDSSFTDSGIGNVVVGNRGRWC
jgi:hypothetical protein